MCNYDKINKIFNKFLCNGNYTQNIHDKISECNYSDINLYFNIININVNVNLTVNEFFLGIKTNKIVTKPTISFLYKNNDNYKFYFYDYESLSNLILNKNLYVIKPILCTIKNKKHILMFIIDKRIKNISMFDPNCNIYISSLIEQNIKNTIIEYNNYYSDSYVFEHILYNSNSLNRFNSKNINGFCVSISLLISHFLLLTKISLRKTIQLFLSLSNDEFLILLKQYSLFYYICIKKF